MNFKTGGIVLALLLAFGVSGVAAQDGTLTDTAQKARQDLDKATRELADLRKQIAGEKIPMNRRLGERENELTRVRRQFEEVGAELDLQTLDLTNLTKELDSRRESNRYLENLLGEYLRNVESQVHISELQRYAETLESARDAFDDSELTPAEVFRAQTDAIEMSIDRLEGLLGGESFEGTAVGEGGLIKDVTFGLVGPVAVFRTKDGSEAGLAIQQTGSLEPNMQILKDEAHGESIAALLQSGSGTLPFDPSLGNAITMETIDEGLLAEFQKGGVVMYPIILLAASALLVALIKLGQLMLVRTPSNRRVDSLLEAVKAKDYSKAEGLVGDISGPTGEMLKAGVEHIREPKELVEEVMYEQTLETRLRLNSFLPFVQVAAAAAPLLGLLGTVTGIISTFQMITVFGTGDAKTLSGGISEALITTKFGLVVAIPSLLLYAYLSRRARRVIDGMEKTAVRFLNRLHLGVADMQGVMMGGAGGAQADPAGGEADGVRHGAPLPVGAQAIPQPQGPDH